MTAGELLPPDDMTLAAAGEALASRLPVRGGDVRPTRRSYYDTFDGLLYAAGRSLVHEDGHLELVERDSGAVLCRAAADRPAKPLFARELGPGPLRDTLADLAGARALLALVELRGRERRFDVLDDERKTVVRLALAEPAVNGHTHLRARLRITPVRGYDKELARVRATLEADLGFIAADQPLVDEAVRATGAVPGGVSPKVELALRGEQRADAAAVAVLRRLLEVMEANLEGAIADLDSEFLHDFRVSLRRSRSVQRELRRVFPPEPLQHFRAEFRWLQQVTGDSRDLDVYVLEFGDFRELVPEAMRSDLDPLLGVLEARRRDARLKMEKALRSERAVSLLGEWRSLLDGLEALDSAERPTAAQPIAEVAGARIRKVYRRMRKMGAEIGPDSPAEAYHELRKKGKELRYLLELFGAPLYPGEVVRPMIKTLKALQDVLGRHQDREVQRATLHALAAEVARRRDGTGAVMAMGALVGRLAEDEQAARLQFAERFAAFAAKDQRRLVRDTFA